jgi:CHAT domain-containing protein/tetratricopeptide (TPR) repeat protein
LKRQGGFWKNGNRMWLPLLGMLLIALCPMGALCQENRDSLFCRLQTRLEIGASLALAKENQAAIDTLTACLKEFPENGDVAFRRMQGEYQYFVGYAAFYESNASFSESHNSIAKSSLTEADSVISLIDGEGSDLKARILRMRGMYCYFMEDNAFDAGDFYEGAYREWLTVPQKDSVEIAVVLQCMGQSARKLGEYEKAIDLYKQSLDIREELFGHLHWRVGTAYWNLGNAYYFAARFAEAKTSLETALNILQSTSPEDKKTIAKITFNLANALDFLGENQAAIIHYEHAIALTKENDGPNASDLVSCLSNLSTVYADESAFGKANLALEEAKRIARNNRLTQGRNVARLLLSEAYIYDLQDHLDKALDVLQAAMHAISEDSVDSSWKDFPNVNSTLEPVLLWEIILYKSDLLSRYASSVPSEAQNPFFESCILGYQLANVIEDRLRSEYQDNEDKLFLSGEGTRHIHSALAATYYLWNINHDPRYLQLALEFIEHNKFQNLLDFFKKSSSLAKESVNRKDVLRLDLLRRQCTELDYRLSLPTLDVDSAKHLQNALVENRLRLRNLQDSLEKSSRLLKTVFHPRQTIEIQKLKDQIPDEKTAVVSFMVADSALFVLCIQKDKSSFRQSSLQLGFSDSIAKFITFCSEPLETKSDVRDFHALGFFLYERLLGPEVASSPTVDRLMIIPDGSLARLPFEALPTLAPKSPTSNLGEIPYLIRKKKCYYEASAALWENQTELSFGNNALECLGMGWGKSSVDSIRGVKGRIIGLPGTENELATVGSFVNGRYLLASEANEATFKQYAPQYGILHLALHARATESDPQILFPAAGNTNEDGILHFYELFGLRLKSRLAVLSSCETGNGKLHVGEGIQSVSSGFAAAGIPSLIMSLWEIDDNSGNTIMGSFYAGLQSGKPIDQSLQEAKLSYLENAEGSKASPFYWSSFVPFGNMNPVQLSAPSSNPTWIVLAALAGCLGIFVTFRIYSKKRKPI